MLRSDDVTPRAYKQVDVFTRTPLQGNPVAVVLEAEGLSTAQCRHWPVGPTFRKPPLCLNRRTRRRIIRCAFSPPKKSCPSPAATLGTAHALLEAGLAPKRHGTVMQECGVGLVAVNIQPEGILAFAAPEVEFRPMAAEETERLMAALRPAVIEGGPCR